MSQSRTLEQIGTDILGPHAQARGLNLGQVGTQYCTIWPEARPLLKLVSQLMMFVPGAGAMAAEILQGLLNVGDQVSTDVCGSVPKHTP